MKVITENRLFWFLKEGTEIDLSNKVNLDMYIQQILSRGKLSDIKGLFKMVRLLKFKESFNRTKRFLPKEIRRFWEEAFGDINKSTEENNNSHN